MRKQSKTLVLCLLVAFLSTCFIPFNTKVQEATPKTLINAVQWADTDGNSINAHGGMMHINGGTNQLWYIEP